MTMIIIKMIPTQSVPSESRVKPGMGQVCRKVRLLVIFFSVGHVEPS